MMMIICNDGLRLSRVVRGIIVHSLIVVRGVLLFFLPETKVRDNSDFVR